MGGNGERKRKLPISVKSIINVFVRRALPLRDDEGRDGECSSVF